MDNAANLNDLVEQCHIDEMTSRDFHCDINARLEVAAQSLRDPSHINYFKTLMHVNKHLFRDQTVLDIGCGLGILSLFAAKAGAKKVYAVDPSNIVNYTREIVRANGFANVIQVIQSRMQNVVLPEKVDIIVCDWAGYSLLFQSLCDAVIFARDNWLKPKTGVILPDVAKLTISAIEDSKIRNERVEWWSNVYGFNMNCLRESALIEPLYQQIFPSQILSSSYRVKNLNLNTATYDDLKVHTKFMLKMLRPGSIDGIMTEFSVSFSKSHVPMTCRIDPWQKGAHWVHTVFLFDKSIVVNADEVDFYGGIEIVSAKPSLCLNDLNINFEMLRGDPSNMDVEVEMKWKMDTRFGNSDDIEIKKAPKEENGS